MITSSSCWRAGVPKLLMFSRAQSKQKRWLRCSTHAVPLRSLMKPLPTSPTAASGRPASALVMGPIDRVVLLGLGDRGGEELGDDLDREDADDAAVVAGHRRVHRLALEQVGGRVGDP